MFGKITHDTAIAGEPVFAGEVVEVDEQTYRQLFRARRIEKCDAPAGAEPELVKKPQPKFKKVSPPQQ